MKIVVLSDLHIGTGSIAKDLCITDTGNAVVEGFIEEFENFVIEQDIIADYLFLAGDISNHAKMDEFSLAAKRIKQFASILKVKENKIFFVPGNHDANWDNEKTSSEKNETEDMVIESKYKYIAKEPFFSSILSNAIKGCYYSEPYFAIWSDDKLNVVGLNTSVFDAHNKEPHHGKIRINDLKQLESYLVDNEIEKSNKINIILLHHHPTQYPDYPFKEPDFSTLQNAPQLMELATKYGFNFVIHGHKHIPQLKQFSDEYDHPVNILCAGSFSARLDDRFFQGIPNTFHVIEIDSVCEEFKTPKGSLTSWSRYAGHGWVKSEERAGVAHREYFGNRLNKAKLEGKLTEIIESEFTHKDHVRWSEIINLCPDIQYCSRKLLSKILKNLSGTIGFETCKLDPNDSDELFILLKG